MSDASFDALLGEFEQKIPFGAGKEDGEQGTPLWLAERCGHCTASRFVNVLDFTKVGKPGAKRTAYLWELVSERITKRPTPHYVSGAMERGIDLESAARMATEARTGQMIMQTGFRKHPTIAWLGGSPDGIIEPDGGWEGKCPVNPQQHLGCWLNGMPAEHMAQVQGLMWLHDAKTWWFSSYHPDYPAPFDLYCELIERDDEYIDGLETQVIKFLAEVDELRAAIEAAGNPK